MLGRIAVAATSAMLTMQFAMPARADIPAIERAALIALYHSTSGDSWTDNSGWKTPPLDTDGFSMAGTEENWHGVGTDSTNVTTLLLTDNGLAGTIPVQLGDLTSLEHLQLSSNRLAGAIPPELGDLSGLQYLELHSNQLTGRLPAELGGLSSLKRFDLNNNLFRGPVPPEFTNLTSLGSRKSDLRNNCLYAAGDPLRNFLNAKLADGGGWEDFQCLGEPNDLIIDFGPTTGIWGFYNNVPAAWVPLSGQTSEHMAAGNVYGFSKNDLLIDFGDLYGLWAWHDNDAGGWTSVAGLSPETIVVGDVDESRKDDAIIDFGDTYGVWAWYNSNHGSWAPVTGLSPELMTVADLNLSSQDDVIFDFGVDYGVWAWYDNDPGSWTHVSTLNPEAMEVGDLDGNGQKDVIFCFGAGRGVWAWYNNDPGGWASLVQAVPEAMVVGDLDGSGTDDVVFDFGVDGIWVFYDNNQASWSKVSGLNPEIMKIGDLDQNGKDDLVVDLGPSHGIWTLYNNDPGAWAPISGLSPTGMTTGNVDSDSCVDCHSSISIYPLAPNVMGDGEDSTGRRYPYDDGTWGYNVNGHGADGTAPNTPEGFSPDSACTDCHDINDPPTGPGAHNNGILNSAEQGLNRSTNTAHLVAGYIDGSPSNDFDVQVQFNVQCDTQCHALIPFWPAFHGHSSNPLGTDIIEFGRSGTLFDGESIPWPIDADISTNANGGAPPSDVDFAICASCHNTHGTNTVEPVKSTNRMLRESWISTNNLCSVCH